jgi:integrase
LKPSKNTLQMIESKMKFGETKISVRKTILTGGRNVSKQTGETKIYVEVIFFYKDGKRKTRRLDTGVNVRPGNFDKKKNDGSVKKSDSESESKNTIINRAWSDYILQLTAREKNQWDESYNPNNLVSLGDMFPKTTKNLLNYLDDYIEYRKSIQTPRNTLKEFTTLKNRLDRYEKDKNTKLTFEDINQTFSDSLYGFLLKEKFMTGTIMKTYEILITFLNYFFDRKDEQNIKLSDKFKSRNFKRGQKSQNEPHPLTHEEFDILLNHNFKTEHLNTTKERFILQCTTGMRYSDLFRITKDNIIEDCICYYPVKTIHKQDNRVECPLNKISKGILEKYDYDSSRLYVSNQKYNDAIEDMFKELNKEHPDIFDLNYTSHNCRDTFISYCAETNVDIPSLLKMVGQSDYYTMKKYFKTTTNHLKERMNDVQVFNE